MRPRTILVAGALTAAATVGSLSGTVAPALAAADTNPNAQPSCMGVFSSDPAARADVPRSVYAHLFVEAAQATGSTPGAVMHALIGAPGQKC